MENSNKMIQDNNEMVFYAKKMLFGGAALSLATMSEKIMTFILLPLFTHYLSPAEFGIVSICMVIVSFLSMLYNPGIVSASIRLFYDMNSMAEKRELISSSVILMVCPGLFVLLLSFFCGESIVGRLFKDFAFYPFGLLAVIGAVLVQPIRLWSTIWVAFNKEYQIAKSFLLRVLLASSVSVILVVVFNLGAFGRVLGQLFGQFLLFAVAMISIYKLGKLVYSLKMMKQILFLGFPLFYGVFAYVVLDIGDRFLIERYMGLKAVGLYDVGYRIAALPVLISSGLNQVWTPIFYKNLKNKSYLIISRLITYFVFLLTAFCGLIILFSKEVFLLFININFLPATEIIPYVTAGVFFLGTSTIFSSTLTFQKKFKEFSVILILSAVLNIVLNILLIPSFGIVGAAIATLIAYFFQNICGYCITNKYAKKYFPVKTLYMISSYLVVSFLFMIFNDTYSFSYTLLGIKIAITLCWIVSLFITGFLKKSEISNFIKVIFKLKN